MRRAIKQDLKIVLLRAYLSQFETVVTVMKYLYLTLEQYVPRSRRVGQRPYIQVFGAVCTPPAVLYRLAAQQCLRTGIVRVNTVITTDQARHTPQVITKCRELSCLNYHVL